MNACCAPTNPPTASAYERHKRAGTYPCVQALADSSAYRIARKKAAKK